MGDNLGPMVAGQTGPVKLRYGTMFRVDAINTNHATIAEGYGDSKSIAKVHAERAALYYKRQTGMAGAIKYRAPVVAI